MQALEQLSLYEQGILIDIQYLFSDFLLGWMGLGNFPRLLLVSCRVIPGSILVVHSSSDINSSSSSSSEAASHSLFTACRIGRPDQFCS